MTNVEKLVERLWARPTEMRADEIATILQHYGWTQRTAKGASHQVWIKPRRESIDYAVDHQRVKRTYLGRIAKGLGLPGDGQ